MSANITLVSGPTQWKPGQSGNLNGRPVGTRQAFSAGFYRDLAEVFAKHGRAAMERIFWKSAPGCCPPKRG